MRRFTVSALRPPELTDIPPRDQAVKIMIRHWEKHLDMILPDRPDLIAVHECCDRFPSMPLQDRLDYYRERGDRVLKFFRRKAVDNHCAIAYSAVRDMPDGTRRNSTILIGRDGREEALYDKNYPMVEETRYQNILPGEKETVAETEVGRLGFAICFDLNFEELLNRYIAAKPRLMLFCSMFHGGLLQSLWAYRCRCWFLGAVQNNQCTLLNPLGYQVAYSGNFEPYLVASVNTDYEVVHWDCNSEKLLRMKQKYGPQVKITDPGYLGSVLVTSETPEHTAAEIIDEFQIERLDDYYIRATQSRQQALQL